MAWTRPTVIRRTVKDVVKLDRPGGTEGGSREAAIFCAVTLHRYGLPVEYARMKSETLRETCACCKAPLWDPAILGTRMEKLVAWQSHLGRCGWDGRRLQAQEVVKRALGDLVLSNPNPGEQLF